VRLDAGTAAGHNRDHVHGTATAAGWARVDKLPGDRVIETVAIGTLLLGALRLLGLLRELEEKARRGVRTR
jgi:hypothetical protein